MEDDSKISSHSWLNAFIFSSTRPWTIIKRTSFRYNQNKLFEFCQGEVASSSSLAKRQGTRRMPSHASAWHRWEDHLILDSTPVFHILMTGRKIIILTEHSQNPKVRHRTGQMHQNKNWTYLTFSIGWICVWFIEDKFFNGLIRTKSMQKLYIINIQNSMNMNITTAMHLSSWWRC